jgi:predicted nucleic-acid-binding protein
VIGLDTNVLVRYLVRDDPRQTLAAEDLLDSFSPEQPGWIGLVALIELTWALRFLYRFQRDGIAGIIESLLRSQDIVVAQENIVHQAVLVYRNSKADFADCLIAASARAAGCSKTVTFDQIAARDAGMELLT